MNLGIDLCGVALKNPVMTASGTFGSGEEYSEFVDLNKLGAVVTKGVANVPWEGNPTPRVAEVYGGMLNAIGLHGFSFNTGLFSNLISIISSLFAKQMRLSTHGAMPSELCRICLLVCVLYFLSS